MKSGRAARFAGDQVRLGAKRVAILISVNYIWGVRRTKKESDTYVRASKCAGK